MKNKSTMNRIRRILQFVFAIWLCLEVNTVVSQPWTYDFGTGTGTHTNSTASTSFLPAPPSGTARVRVGTNPGSIVMANPGLVDLGTGTELQITSNTGSASTTKFSVYDYTPGKSGYVKFSIVFAGGTDGEYNFTLGDGTTFSDNNAMTNAQIFAGIRWNFGASDAVSYSVLNNTTWGTTGITDPTTLFSQSTSTVFNVEIYANNTLAEINYLRGASTYSLAADKWDLWVNGTRVGSGLASAALPNDANIDSFAFNHQTSKTTPGTLYIDDIEYSNSLPIQINTPNINVNPTSLTGLGYEEGSGPSFAQTIDVSGSNLDPAAGNITVTSTLEFAVSLDNASFSNQVDIPYSAGTLTSTTVYVRLKAGLDADNYSGNLGLSGGDATPVLVTLSGVVIAPPPPAATFTATGYQENFSTFTGTGFSASPDPGQLHSGNWRVRGMSDGSGVFDGTYLTGDYARGTSNGGVTTGGVYAFNVGSGTKILGVQPGGSDFTPGDFTLRLENTSGETIENLLVEYDIYVYNDQNRSSSFNIGYSSNDDIYIIVSSQNYTTPAAADGSPSWQLVPRSTIITGLNIADGDYLYLQWLSDDVGGVDNRDEFGLTNINLELTSAPAVAQPVFDPAPGTYYADQTVFISNYDTYGPSVEVRYTLDGSEPDDSSLLYDDNTGIMLADGNGSVQVRAVAIDTNLSIESTINNGTYEFPVNVADIGALRALTAGTPTKYRLTGEAVVTLVGIITNGTHKQVFIQDGTGAILIHDAGSSVITSTLNIGDGLVNVIGTLSPFNQMLQFNIVKNPVVNSTGNVVTPVVRTLADLTSADQAKLLTVYGVTFAAGGSNFLENTSYTINDGSGGIFNARYGNLPYIGDPIPDGTHITGVMLQFNAALQLVSRNSDDFFTTELDEVIDPVTVQVLFQTSYDDAIAQLPQTTTITDELGNVFVVNIINWTIPDYNPNVPGNYTAYGEVVLPPWITGGQQPTQAATVNVSTTITVLYPPYPLPLSRYGIIVAMVAMLIAAGVFFRRRMARS